MLIQHRFCGLLHSALGLQKSGNASYNKEKFERLEKNMNLRTKYLLVLNGIILTMWVVYAAWSLQKTEESFMKAEMSSIKHLGLGIGLLVELSLDKTRSAP